MADEHSARSEENAAVPSCRDEWLISQDTDRLARGPKQTASQEPGEANRDCDKP